MMQRIPFKKPNQIRGYFTRVHKYNHVPVPFILNVGMSISIVTSFVYFTYTSLWVRPEYDRVVDPSKAYVNPVWVDYWLKLRDEKRIQGALERSILEEEPEKAAEKILEWARTSAQNKILEDLKLLKPALSPATIAQFEK
uniref:COXEG3 n=1 Tax=Euglena gracilis TaxID=3039 RepID=UPI002FE4FA93